MVAGFTSRAVRASAPIWRIYVYSPPFQFVSLKGHFDLSRGLSTSDAAPVLDSPKIQYFWRIWRFGHTPVGIFEESEQHFLMYSTVFSFTPEDSEVFFTSLDSVFS